MLGVVINTRMFKSTVADHVIFLIHDGFYVFTNKGNYSFCGNVGKQCKN